MQGRRIGATAGSAVGRGLSGGSKDSFVLKMSSCFATNFRSAIAGPSYCVLILVLNRPEVDAIIGHWQEDCPRLFFERQYTEGETRSGVARNAA